MLLPRDTLQCVDFMDVIMGDIPSGGRAFDDGILVLTLQV